jgi:hypothetical protein
MDIDSVIAKFNTGYSSYLAVRKLFSGVVSGFKVPFVVDNMVGLEFDNTFRKWEFPVELEMQNLSPEQLCGILGESVNLCEQLPATVAGVKSTRMCPHCRKITRQVICEKCKRFATCRLCCSKKCTECESQNV